MTKLDFSWENYVDSMYANKPSICYQQKGKKSYMIISINTHKSICQDSTSFHDKTLNCDRNRQELAQTDKGIYKKPQKTKKNKTYNYPQP